MANERSGRIQTVPYSSCIRFGPYELDLRSAELRKNRVRIRLQEQPFLILVALLERPGEVVLRQELRDKLWPGGTVVEFDHGINAAVKRLRAVLCESVEKPRYIETLARKGYRFIGTVEPGSSAEAEFSPGSEKATVSARGCVSIPETAGNAVVVQHEEGRAVAAENAPPFQFKRNLWRIVGGGIALIAVSFGIAVTPGIRPGIKPISEMTRLTFDSGLTTDPAVSPDGKLMAYASDRGGNHGLHIWVQQLISNGQAVQLTRGEDDDHQPAFSPDATKVAFRSERDGGGIYVVPAVGGEATLIAKGGRDPRFSPDGKLIAYWETEMMAAPWVASYGTIYLVPSVGGTPQPITSDLREAGVPQWSEDNKRLIVFGRKSESNFDWWVVPIDGGPATSTHAFAMLKAKGFSCDASWAAPRVASWRGNDLLFSAQRGDSTNVWKVHMDSSTLRVMDEPQQLTSGTGLEAYPTLTADGRLLFASLTNSSDVWIVPVDTDRARATGRPRRATETIGPHHFASLSSDGKLLAYSSVRYGFPRAWIRNFERGTVSPVLSDATSQRVSQLSSDGSLLVYTTGGENGAGFVVPVHEGAANQFCTDCAAAYDLSPDNRVVLYRKRIDIRSFDLVSRHDRLFMRSSNYHLFQHKFSPDSRWVTFEALQGNRSQLFVTAFKNEAEFTPENEWVLLTGSEGWADKPRWSPNGNFIYFISNRDGFFCLWAQRVTADSKRPKGPPLSIAHFHESRLSVGNVGSGAVIELSVARDKIALNLGELTGNIWVTDFHTGITSKR